MIKNRFYILKSNQRKEKHANILSNENNSQNNEIKLSASEASSNLSTIKNNSNNKRNSSIVSTIVCVPSYEVDMNAENEHNSYNNPEYINLIDNTIDQTNWNELSRPRKGSDIQIFGIEKNNNFTESYNNIFKQYPADNTESYEELYNMFFLDSHQQKIKETEATTNNLQNSYNSYLDLNNPSDRLIFEKFNSIKKSFISINEIKNEFIINNNEVLSNILFY